MTRQCQFQPQLSGRPSDELDRLPAPSVVHVPCRSRRFHFTELQVQSGSNVAAGDVLAVDPNAFNVPLLAPFAGVVSVDAEATHITVEGHAAEPPTSLEKAPGGSDAENESLSVDQLVRGGCWPFLADAHTQTVPNPGVSPRAVVVSGAHADLFVARAEVILHGCTDRFLRGLKALATLLKDVPIYVAMPDSLPEPFADLNASLNRMAGVEVVHVPDTYPSGSPGLVARMLGLREAAGSPVWSMSVEGVLAIETVLVQQRPATVKYLTVGGPGVVQPRHFEAVVGHPLASIPNFATIEHAGTRIIGGVMTGTELPEAQLGVDVECDGLTVLAAPGEREFLGFVRPGADRRSFSRCFLSTLFRRAPSPDTSLLQGEKRACVACGYCERVCPANLLPQILHRYLYAKDKDGAAEVGLGLCIECGLCSYVCPAKIELRQEFADAKQQLRNEAAEAAEHAALTT